MSNSFLVRLYSLLPKSVKKTLGQSRLLKPFRRYLLYTKKGFKTATESIERRYGSYNLGFKFVASIKVVSKAKQFGIENTLLRNSFKLLDTYYPNRNDLIVLDVGANFGYLATVWAHSISKHGKTMAFEPNKNLYNCIKKTIEANESQHNFEVYNLAVGATDGSITLNVSDFSSNKNKMDDSVGSYEIAMVTLDSFIIETQEVHLLKIDVDGIELDILQGAKNMLQKHRPIVIVETNNDNRIISFFKNLDYHIFDMKLNAFQSVKEPLPLNIFCIPNALNKHVV